MKTRTISAIIALAVFIPIIVFGGMIFAITMAILGIIGLYELATMQKIKYFNLIGIVSSIAMCTLVLPDKYLPVFLSYLGSDVIVYLCGMFLLVLTVYKYHELNFNDVAVLIFGVLYIGFGFHYLILIRDIGLATIIYQFLVIWSTDTGAYLVGVKYGKNKLAPEISPNKTIEGSIGGVLTALITSSIYLYYFPTYLPNQDYIWILTILLSCTGQLGDLVESAYKRHFNVKDSGRFLPGHGGVLDRFDSTIFTSFMLVIWLNIF